MSAPALADTVTARPDAPLVVVARDAAGRNLPGARVRFVVPRSEDSRGRVSVLIATVPPAEFGTGTVRDTVEVVADDSARARVWLRFGTRPDSVVLTAAAPGATPLAVPVVTRPGAVDRVTLEPADTAVYAGARYPLRLTLADIYGNPTQGGSYAAGGPVQVSPEGAVTAADLGRGRVVLAAGRRADTAWVSVVPRGTLAVTLRHEFPSGDPTIALVGLDGSGLTRLLTPSPVNSYHALSPAWAPDAATLACTPFYSTQAVGVRTADGVLRAATATTPAEGWRFDRWPEYSRDGRWIYFAVSSSTYSRLGRLYRVPAGATAALPTLVASFDAPFDYDPAVTVSPDGTQAVIAVGGRMMRVDLATGDARELPITGSTPRWSPSGAYVAYVGHDYKSVRVARPDGTGARTVATAAAMSLGLAWSPDERWIVAHLSPTLTLVEVATGQLVPLPHGKHMFEPAWKP